MSRTRIRIGVHIGPSLNAGHYKAFVAVRNDTWVCADDADTTEVGTKLKLL